jgi:hypothetical protein
MKNAKKAQNWAWLRELKELYKVYSKAPTLRCQQKLLTFRGLFANAS